MLWNLLPGWLETPRRTVSVLFGHILYPYAESAGPETVHSESDSFICLTHRRAGVCDPWNPVRNGGCLYPLSSSMYTHSSSGSSSSSSSVKTMSHVLLDLSGSTEYSVQYSSSVLDSVLGSGGLRNPRERDERRSQWVLHRIPWKNSPKYRTIYTAYKRTEYTVASYSFYSLQPTAYSLQYYGVVPHLPYNWAHIPNPWS